MKAASVEKAKKYKPKKQPLKKRLFLIWSAKTKSSYTAERGKNHETVS